MRVNNVLFLVGLIFSLVILSGAESLAQDAKSSKTKEKSYVQEAWGFYNVKDYKKAIGYADKTIAYFDVDAKKQQSSLIGPVTNDKIPLYWALNDVATAKFIKAKIYMETAELDKAKALFNDIIENYKYAMAYDLRGWYWNVAKASGLMIDSLHSGLDFGDGSSSAITTKAWESYNGGDYNLAMVYADKCIDLYRENAILQQEMLTEYPSQEDIPRYWALNDVGTSFFIAAKSASEVGQLDKAERYFNFIKEKLPFASSWNPSGWHWKISDSVDEELKNLSSSDLKK